MPHQDRRLVEVGRCALHVRDVVGYAMPEPARLSVVPAELHGADDVAASAQAVRERVPTPRPMPGPMNEEEVAHSLTSLTPSTAEVFRQARDLVAGITRARAR
jgi:hypothetical protein